MAIVAYTLVAGGPADGTDSAVYKANAVGERGTLLMDDVCVNLELRSVKPWVVQRQEAMVMHII
jgi:hypothetical protein